MVRGVLGVLRTLVLLLLVLVALGPVLAYTTRHQVDPFVILAIDVSKSMSAKDKYLDDDAVKPISSALAKSPEAIRGQQPTRAELVQAAFGRKRPKNRPRAGRKGPAARRAFRRAG